MSNAFLVLLALSTASAVDVAKRPRQFAPLSRASLVSIPMRSYRHDCWKKRPVASSFLQHTKNPGAGMDPDSIEPYVTVTKDGFFGVDCVKDAMMQYGDKFGSGKHKYKMGDSANVSIVHYTDMVAKEDREKMTHQVCFDFCRTVPEMLFFGLNMGRDCYCAPFFMQMAGDSSNCDQVCEGDKTQMCGGELKSSIFEMHSCDDTEKVLTDAAEKAQDLLTTLGDTVSTLKGVAEQGEADANVCQESFGAAGDPAASDLMQSAKALAGELIHASEDGQDIVDEFTEVVDEAHDLDGSDFKDFENAQKADKAVKKLEEGIAAAEEETEKLEKLLGEANPDYTDEEDKVTDASKQYYPIMHFVDKEFVDSPSTCGGNVIQTVFGKSMDECAVACDDLVGKCVGFSYFGEGDGLCFLMDEFKTVQYYTGCSGEKFLQVKGAKSREGPFVATCVAKLQDFEGTTLKPDKSGKCKMCLKEATNAARCFE